MSEVGGWAGDGGPEGGGGGGGVAVGQVDLVQRLHHDGPQPHTHVFQFRLSPVSTESKNT